MLFNTVFIKLFRLLNKLRFNIKTKHQISVFYIQKIKHSQSQTLGYKLLNNPKKTVFFSLLKTYSSANLNKKNYINSSFRQLFYIKNTKYFVFYLRSYFFKFFFHPTRTFKTNKFFKLFFTWKSSDLIVFFNTTILFLLQYLGVATTYNQCLYLHKKKWLYLNGLNLTTIWQNINDSSILIIIYSNLTLNYFKNTTLQTYKSVRKIKYWYWLFIKKKHNYYYNRSNVIGMFNAKSYWNLSNKCFLTLTFFIWQVSNNFLKQINLNWLNWLNFNTHNWKYLS